MVTLLSYVQHVWLGKGENVDFLKSKIGVNRENISLIKLGLIAHNFGHLIAVFTCQEHDLFTKKNGYWEEKLCNTNYYYAIDAIDQFVNNHLMEVQGIT